VNPEVTVVIAFTVCVAVLVESPAAVAVTVTLPVEAGSVKSPELLIVPADAVQFTAELKLPVPETFAVHWSVCETCVM
jgi:hypothetical protein